MIKTHAIEVPAAADRQPDPGDIRPAPVAATAPSPPRLPPIEEPQRPAPRLVAEHAPREPEPRGEVRARDGNGGNGAHGRYFAGRPEAAAPAAATYPDRSPPNPDSRRTLHLSLGNGGEPAPQHQPGAERQPMRQTPAAPPPSRPAAAYPGGANQGPVRMLPEAPKGRDGGAIDSALRERVEGDIAAFLAAFDTALAGDTPESRAGLREATDRLLRAGARTRIELERLEARVPLPPRDRRDQDSLEWRHR